MRQNKLNMVNEMKWVNFVEQTPLSCLQRGDGSGTRPYSPEKMCYHQWFSEAGRFAEWVGVQEWRFKACQ